MFFLHYYWPSKKGRHFLKYKETNFVNCDSKKNKKWKENVFLKKDTPNNTQSGAAESSVQEKKRFSFLSSRCFFLLFHSFNCQDILKNHFFTLRTFGAVIFRIRRKEKKEDGQGGYKEVLSKQVRSVKKSKADRAPVRYGAIKCPSLSLWLFGKRKFLYFILYFPFSLFQKTPFPSGV